MTRAYMQVNGGLIDPKHIGKMGPRIWLYLYMMYLADWDTGEVHRWTDTMAADALEMHLPTVTQQRRRLEEEGYIECKRIQNGTRIQITKWSGTKRRPRTDIRSDNRSDNPPHVPSLDNTDSILHSRPDGRDASRRILEEAFKSATNLPAPRTDTPARKKKAGELWWAPLREIGEMAGWDDGKAAGLITKAVGQMRRAKLTIASPKSIVKVCLSLVAEGLSKDDVRYPKNWQGLKHG